MDARERSTRLLEEGWGQSTVCFLVLLILSHGFEACGTSKEFVAKAGLVVRLGTVLAIDVLVGL